MNYFNHEIERELEEISKEINECRSTKGHGRCQCGGGHVVRKPTHQISHSNAILVVGQAPGPKGWWVTGVAFYQRKNDATLELLQAGKNLNECLTLLCTRLEKSYYVDAVKCKPDSTNQLRVAQRYCLHFLKKQMFTIKPPLILALGKIATKSCLQIKGERVLSKFKLKDVVGNAKEWQAPWGQCWILPLYFPGGNNNGRWPENKEYIGKFLAEHPKWQALMS